MTYAILKPDHLGDLVLSSAAIRAITTEHRDTVLFVASKNVALARYLFPDVDVRTVDLAHLSKTGSLDRMPDLGQFDLVAILRNDAVVNVDWATLRMRGFIQHRDSHDLHQSMMDYTVASLLVGRYDIDKAFYGAREARVVGKALSPARRIGLSIGSGFHANTWPMARWVETARALLDRADSVTVLCGPAEREKATSIVAQMGRPSSVDVVVGGHSIRDFIAAVDDLDLVVASDGGTAHLCSLVTPIVSIFGPSPFRRYAPYGRYNRLLTRQLPCSPCVQYTTHIVNGCLTTECMSGISIRHLERALAPPDPSSPARRWPAQDSVHLYVGASHLAREARLTEFDREARRSADIAALPGLQDLANTAVLADLQDARLALIDALDRLKRAPSTRYAAGVRRVALSFAKLREMNVEARARLSQHHASP